MDLHTITESSQTQIHRILETKDILITRYEVAISLIIYCTLWRWDSASFNLIQNSHYAHHLTTGSQFIYMYILNIF